MKCKCQYCKARFSSPRTSHICVKCRPLVNRARAKASYEAKCGRLEADGVEEFVREQVIQAIMERDGTKIGRCPYCGRERILSDGYCSSCNYYGYASIHRLTGRTNGWDAAERKRALEVEGGWRGQKCAGGGRALNDFFH